MSQHAIPHNLLVDQYDDVQHRWPEFTSPGGSFLPDTPHEDYSPMNLMTPVYSQSPMNQMFNPEYQLSLMDFMMSVPLSPPSLPPMSQILNYTSPISNKVAEKKPILNRKRNPNAESPNRIECQDCGSMFKRKADLRRHQQCVHMEVRPFVCPHVCGAAFSRKDALKRHLTHKSVEKVCAGFRKNLRQVHLNM